MTLAGRWKGPVTFLGGPQDTRWLRKVIDQIGPQANFVAEEGFTQTFDAIRQGAIAVGNDTGLLHLCLAFGMPVITIFGPTTSADGFWHFHGEVIEKNLFCRPCSRYGSSQCPIGDHQCMTGISVDEVWQSIQRHQT